MQWHTMRHHLVQLLHRGALAEVDGFQLRHDGHSALQAVLLCIPHQHDETLRHADCQGVTHNVWHYFTSTT